MNGRIRSFVLAAGSALLMTVAVPAFLAGTAIAGEAGAPKPSRQAAYAAWKAAHPALASELADLKSKTAKLVAAAGPAPAPPAKYADLLARSQALDAASREQASRLFEQGIERWQAGDYKAAKQIITDGLALDPASGVGNFYLGDVLDRMGDKTTAAIAMDRARTLAPDSLAGARAAVALSSLNLPSFLTLPSEETPELDRPPAIWRVPGAITDLWDDPDAPRLVVIPAGEFTMGSPAAEAGRNPNEGPRRRVRIADAFAVGKYPVTVGEFARFVASTGYDAGDQCQTFIKQGKLEFVSACDWRNPGFPQGDDHPAVALDWHAAQAYVAWLSKKTGKTYRLLSEAEYEYATRGGTTTAYWWGDDPGIACAYANGGDLVAKAVADFDFWTVNRCHDGFSFTAPVGSFKPNPFGLYDMVGNAVSWLQDCSIRAPSDGSPIVPGGCLEPMNRGGSWADNPASLRSAVRGWNIHNIHFTLNGFRVARVL